jgi:hypothetical protein
LDWRFWNSSRIQETQFEFQKLNLSLGLEFEFDLEFEKLLWNWTHFWIESKSIWFESTQFVFESKFDFGLDSGFWGLNLFWVKRRLSLLKSNWTPLNSIELMLHNNLECIFAQKLHPWDNNECQTIILQAARENEWRGK